MKKLLCVPVLLLSCHALADQESEKVNYGDPTAIYSGVGINHSKQDTQANLLFGYGATMLSVDLSRDYQRGRLFHVTDGLGFSGAYVNTKVSKTAMVGMLYTVPVLDSFTMFPYANLGMTEAKVVGKPTSAVGQVGIHGAYSLEGGHWLYASPKMNYHHASKKPLSEIELGGGYMLTEWSSIGTRVDIKEKRGTTTWFQLNAYF